MMNGAEGSELAVVAMKPTNKSSPGDAERGEQRTRTEGTPDQQSTRRTQSRESVAQALDRIRQATRSGKGEKFTALRIPTQGGQVIRFHRGHHSDLIAATLPI